jgi:hypothetical protein
MRTFFLILALALMTHLAVNAQTTPSSNMMVRIAEIEIDSTYLEEYMAILKEESSMSVKLETGVISIFPMFQKDILPLSDFWKYMPAKKRIKVT